jgi:hypothetical protein
MAKVTLNTKQRFDIIKWLTVERREAFRDAGCDWRHVADRIKEELGLEINHKDVLVRLLEAAGIESFFPVKAAPLNLSDVLEQRFAAMERKLERLDTLMTNLYNQVEAEIPK